MDETSGANHSQELRELKVLLWGNEVRQDIFRRWSQGFHFSPYEASALEQLEGGPCAVLAPVQAFLIKNLLLEAEPLNCIGNICSEKRDRLLVQAMCEILQQCVGAGAAGLYRVVVRRRHGSDAAEPEAVDDGHSFLFHEGLEVLTLGDAADLRRHYTEQVAALADKYGVLLFLYSVLMTKGVRQVKLELADSSETLIHETYGYGSQGLINLMLTGRAVCHVWDNEQDLGGLKLPGIDRQSQVGFVTLMEHMRYCTVGSFYKNPKHPVWVLGSETHLTVLFSDERRLVSPETQSERARRVFKSYDPDGNNFISAALLQDVLTALDLVSEAEYVDIMRRKLDPEQLGIILLNAFMDEFFEREQSSTPDTFTLMHYNGLRRSNPEGRVRYGTGVAVLLECQLKSMCEGDPMLTCLQTKWPSIEISWAAGGAPPSLN